MNLLALGNPRIALHTFGIGTHKYASYFTKGFGFSNALSNTKFFHIRQLYPYMDIFSEKPLPFIVIVMMPVLDTQNGVVGSLPKHGFSVLPW